MLYHKLVLTRGWESAWSQWQANDCRTSVTITWNQIAINQFFLRDSIWSVCVCVSARQWLRGEKVIPSRDINFIISFIFFSHRKKKKSPEINAVFTISDALHMLKIFWFFFSLVFDAALKFNVKIILTLNLP